MNRLIIINDNMGARHSLPEGVVELVALYYCANRDSFSVLRLLNKAMDIARKVFLYKGWPNSVAMHPIFLAAAFEQVILHKNPGEKISFHRWDQNMTIQDLGNTAKTVYRRIRMPFQVAQVRRASKGDLLVLSVTDDLYVYGAGGTWILMAQDVKCFDVSDDRTHSTVVTSNHDGTACVFGSVTGGDALSILLRDHGERVSCGNWDRCLTFEGPIEQALVGDHIVGFLQSNGHAHLFTPAGHRNRRDVHQMSLGFVTVLVKRDRLDVLSTVGELACSIPCTEPVKEVHCMAGFATFVVSLQSGELYVWQLDREYMQPILMFPLHTAHPVATIKAGYGSFTFRFTDGKIEVFTLSALQQMAV